MARLPQFNMEGLNFLLVDEDEHMRDTVADMLRSFRVGQVKVARNGKEAIEALGTFNADIIIPEWEMSELDGVELTRAIRGDERSPHRAAAIIMLSAHTQVSQVTKARDAGITEYLAKPVTAKTLYARICSVIERPRSFIESRGYVGPDRRRKHDPFLVGQARRDLDKAKASDGEKRDITEDELNAMLGL